MSARSNRKRRNLKVRLFIAQQGKCWLFSDALKELEELEASGAR